MSACAAIQTGSYNRGPWIVGNKVRLFCQTSGPTVRIASFSTADYTVADSGYDLSAYMGVDPFDDLSKMPQKARVYGSYTYLLSTYNSLRPQVIKLANDYSTIEVINTVEI
jgi:hypothetical protein